MLQSLTSLRFFAAMMVVLSHLPGTPFYEGYTGVTFFFVLSGFILSFRYADPFRRGTVSHPEFWIGRIARVYPLHLLTMLLALPAALMRADAVWALVLQLFAQLTLTQAAVPVSSVYFSFDFPAWSLSVEAFFYLLFPLLTTTRTSHLLVVLATVVAYQLGVSHVDRGVHFLAYIFPPARLADFVTGILIFRLFERHRTISAATATISQCCALGLLVACYAVAPHVSQGLRYDVFYLLPMAGIVLSCAWQNGALARLMSYRWLVFLGDASFALYLVHQLIIRAADFVFGVRGTVISALDVLVSVALAALLHVWFEGRAKAIVSGYLRRKLFGDEPFAVPR